MGTVIRRATEADYDEYVQKGLAFNASVTDIPVDMQKARRWFDLHMSGGVIFLSEAGFLAGLFIEDPIRNYTALAETAWYDPGRNGLRLLRKFIAYGREQGADEIRMTTLHNSPPQATTVLHRMGFHTFEYSHRLVI